MATLLFLFTTFATGGPQRRTVDLINHWGDRYRYKLAAFDNRFDALERLDPAVPAERLELDVPKGGLAQLASTVPALRRCLRETGADLLVTLNWGSVEAGLANRWRAVLPQIHMEEGFGPEEGPERQLPRRVWMRRIALSGKHQTVVVPSHVLKGLARDRWGLRNVVLIRNGIDLNRYVPHHRERQGPVTVGTVAALRQEKNIGRLIRAAANVPALNVLIGGDGPERPALEALARDLGLAERVTFLGHVAAPEEVYRRLDLFALSSDTEQMPLSLMEAMASGLPVLATDVGDVKRMVAEANAAYVIPPEQAAAYSTALASLAADAGLRADLGTANRARAQAEFSFERSAFAHAELIDNRLGRTTGA